MTDRPDTKVAVLLRDDLETWQRLNVTAFLTSGIAAAFPGIIGEPYADADGTAYLAMIGQPVLVMEGDRDLLRLAHERALRRDLVVSVFTRELFTTGDDEANRAAVAAVAAADLDLVGLGVHAPRGVVDKVLKGAHLHP